MIFSGNVSRESVCRADAVDSPCRCFRRRNAGPERAGNPRNPVKQFPVQATEARSVPGGAGRASFFGGWI